VESPPVVLIPAANVCDEVHVFVAFICGVFEFIGPEKTSALAPDKEIAAFALEDVTGPRCSTDPSHNPFPFSQLAPSDMLYVIVVLGATEDRSTYPAWMAPADVIDPVPVVLVKNANRSMIVT
jgi:hypothetical protein